MSCGRERARERWKRRRDALVALSLPGLLMICESRNFKWNIERRRRSEAAEIEFLVSVFEPELGDFDAVVAGRESRQSEVAGFVGPTDPGATAGCFHQPQRGTGHGEASAVRTSPSGQYRCGDHRRSLALPGFPASAGRTSGRVRNGRTAIAVAIFFTKVLPAP